VRTAVVCCLSLYAEVGCLLAGNPCDSDAVAEFVSGYCKYMQLRGYRRQAAAPWKAADVERVAAHLIEQVALSTGVDRVLLSRDLFCLTIQWACVTRGLTAAEWRLEDISVHEGTYF